MKSTGMRDRIRYSGCIPYPFMKNRKRKIAIPVAIVRMVPAMRLPFRLMERNSYIIPVRIRHMIAT